MRLSMPFVVALLSCSALCCARASTGASWFISLEVFQDAACQLAANASNFVSIAAPLAIGTGGACFTAVDAPSIAQQGISAYQGSCAVLDNNSTALSLTTYSSIGCDGNSSLTERYTANDPTAQHARNTCVQMHVQDTQITRAGIFSRSTSVYALFECSSSNTNQAGALLAPTWLTALLLLLSTSAMTMLRPVST